MKHLTLVCPLFPKKACKMQILNKLVFGDIANYHGAPFTICNHPLHPDVGVSCCPHSDKLSEFLVWHRFYTGMYLVNHFVLQFEHIVQNFFMSHIPMTYSLLILGSVEYFSIKGWWIKACFVSNGLSTILLQFN